MKKIPGFFVTTSLEKYAKKFMLEAWNEHKWIYDHIADEWYTPEEFKHKWELLLTQYNTERYILRSPFEGWGDALEKIAFYVERSEKLKAKIEGYYDMDLKRKSRGP
ncbi:hypothetical protein, partial [Parapedobacter indicus]